MANDLNSCRSIHHKRLASVGHDSKPHHIRRSYDIDQIPLLCWIHRRSFVYISIDSIDTHRKYGKHLTYHLKFEIFTIQYEPQLYPNAAIIYWYFRGVLIIELRMSSTIEVTLHLQSKVLKSAGYIFALVALTLSALGTIFTKMMTGSFAKFVILCYLGMGIGVAAILQLLLFPSLDAPLFPDDANVWTQAILIACFGTLQQFLLVCKFYS